MLLSSWPHELARFQYFKNVYLIYGTYSFTLCDTWEDTSSENKIAFLLKTEKSTLVILDKNGYLESITTKIFKIIKESTTPSSILLLFIILSSLFLELATLSTSEGPAINNKVLAIN